MGYREKWFKANRSFLGLYRCSKCRKLFRKKKIEIDHRIPKRKGGTDDLWNLQPMCRHCNRSKHDSMSASDKIGTYSRAALHGGLFKAMDSVDKQEWRDLFGRKYYRNGKPKKRKRKKKSLFW